VLLPVLLLQLVRRASPLSSAQLPADMLHQQQAQLQELHQQQLLQQQQKKKKKKKKKNACVLLLLLSRCRGC